MPESTFRASGIEGDIYALATETAGDTNRWVAEVVNHVLTGFSEADYDFLQMVANYTGDELFGFRREPGT